MRGQVALCVAAGLLWQAVAVAVPAVLQRAVDDGLLGADRAALVTWVAVLAALGLVRWIGDAARHWWVERSGARAALLVRRRLIGHLLDLDDDAAARLGQGRLVARATTDVDALWVWVSGIATLVTAAFTVVAVGVALLSLGPDLAAVGLAAVPVAALVAARHVRRQHRAAAAAAAAG
ncbi:MAG TPA: ABC transporter transmembrane domain-containing protein, partial [Pseudonocardia sp.]|nr:ABC transporter transmembrane domain-containing protein [Pseudonocardia sp.]